MIQRLVIFLLLTCFVSPVLAIVDKQEIMPEEFKSTEEKHRFRELIKDLRCTVCQNQNLADSNASLARDLRHQVLDQMHAGKNNEQIVDYLVSRYGDFVLYNPPFKATTFFLWVGPFLFFTIAVISLFVLIRRRNQQATTALSDDEAAQLQAAIRNATQKESKEN